MAMNWILNDIMPTPEELLIKHESLQHARIQKLGEDFLQNPFRTLTK